MRSTDSSETHYSMSVVVRREVTIQSQEFTNSGGMLAEGLDGENDETTG